MKDIPSELIRSSRIYMKKQRAHCERHFKLGQYNRMDYEQETGKMIFSDVGVIPRVVADFQIVGSLSSRSDTWLWAWDNPYLLENTVTAVREVRKFGEENCITKLTEPKWKAEEKDAWDMTAVAAYILKALEMYAFPSDEIMVFTILTSIKPIGTGSPPNSISTGDMK